MKKWVEFMTPGAAHEQLDGRVGTWNVSMEIWSAPGASPTVSEAVSEVKWIMGRRYLLDATKGNYSGLPFEGLGMTGYDNLKQKFVLVWVDNMGTGMMTGSGTYDAATKTYTFATLAPDVVGGTDKPGRLVERIVSDNQWVMEMYDTTPEGQEFVTLKAVYTRGK
jgi:hypothetical protein